MTLAMQADALVEAAPLHEETLVAQAVQLAEATTEGIYPVPQVKTDVAAVKVTPPR